MTTTFLAWPPEPAFPTINLRRPDVSCDAAGRLTQSGEVCVVLAPGGTAVSLDEHWLSPFQARALGMVASQTMSLRNAGAPSADSASEVEPGVIVGARSDGDVFTLSVHAGERTTLWTGPTSNAPELALALFFAGRAALDIDAYVIAQSLPVDGRNAFSPRLNPEKS